MAWDFTPEPQYDQHDEDSYYGIPYKMYNLRDRFQILSKEFGISYGTGESCAIGLRGITQLRDDNARRLVSRFLGINIPDNQDSWHMPRSIMSDLVIFCVFDREPDSIVCVKANEFMYVFENRDNAWKWRDEVAANVTKDCVWYSIYQAQPRVGLSNVSAATGGYS